MKRRVETLVAIGRRIGKPRGWERVVRMFAPPERCSGLGEMTLEREGIAFISQPMTPVGWNVLFFGSYEPELRQLFRRLVPPDGVALDVGANVGWHTLLLSRLVGSGGLVLAAEPNPSIRTRLERHLRMNSVENVTVLPYAFADADGVAGFAGATAEDAESGSGHLLGCGEALTSTAQQVVTRSVDSIVSELRLERLDAIKVDVEGFEWPVLCGAESSVERFRPHLFFEHNRDYLSRSGTIAGEMEEFLHRHRYQVFEVSRSGRRLAGSGGWPQCADLWASPET